MSGILIAVTFYVLFIIVLKAALHAHWARQLQEKHGRDHSFLSIFKRIGRLPYYIYFRQPFEDLDPSFRNDIERAQNRSGWWDAGLFSLGLAAMLVWYHTR